MTIAMSSGHGRHIRGASGLIDEVVEARRVVERVAGHLGTDVVTFHDNTSDSQDENLETIVNWHNAQQRDLDVSVHFNAYEPTSEPMGTEVLYYTASDAATRVAGAIARSGLINRGAKKRTDLYFLVHTEQPAILIEVCFVDSTIDVEIYRSHFDEICRSIAMALRREEGRMPLASFYGPCSSFGGPADSGVSPDEGLAFFFDYDDAPTLFLERQPPGTTGLARRLDPATYYVACRWDYEVTPKDMLADLNNLAIVFSSATGRLMLAHPADWGPHEDTGRAADLSPALMEELNVETDDPVQVIYPVSLAPRG
jgi:N-acetylmuramoyl-L-alanine amidase